MKTTIYFLSAIVMMSSILSSCKKDGSTAAPVPFKCALCKTAPDALAANDAISKGIYKGVLIGSTGTIMFDIANNGSDITAVMVIDGVTVNLVSVTTWAAGVAYVAPFTGTYNGNPVSITFSIDVSGANPTVTASNIPGHPNTTFTIIKETSQGLVECFEGSYNTTRPETGTFNIILARTLAQWSGNGRETNTTTDDRVHGTIVNNQLRADNGIIIGTLSSDQLDGSFNDGNGATVTITGRRTF